MRLGSHQLRSAGLVAVVGMLAMLLAACGGVPTRSGQAPKDQQILKPLEIGPSAGDLATLDPALITFASDYDHAQQILPGLITLNNDLNVQDWAAQRHVVSSDGLTPIQPSSAGSLVVSPGSIAAHPCPDGAAGSVTLTLTNTGGEGLTWEGSVQKGSPGDISRRTVSPETSAGEADNAFDHIVFAWSSGDRSGTMTVSEECKHSSSDPNPP